MVPIVISDGVTRRNETKSGEQSNMSVRQAHIDEKEERYVWYHRHIYVLQYSPDEANVGIRASDSSQNIVESLVLSRTILAALSRRNSSSYSPTLTIVSRGNKPAAAALCYDLVVYSDTRLCEGRQRAKIYL